MFMHRVDAIAKHNGKNWTTFYSDFQTKRLQPWNEMMFQAHTNGRLRLGSYSTAPWRNDCRWICADFDEHIDAFDQAIELSRKLQEYGLFSGIQRSNGGKGYHAYLWFSQPVPAAVARRMMLGALMLAGIPTHGRMQKGSNSGRAYDRLFPSQDKLQFGGYGNLVGLPLYGNAVKQGNTLFVDETGQSFEEQWEWLQDVYHNHRIAPDHPAIAELGKYAPSSQGVQAVQTAHNDDSYWLALGKLPGRVEAMRNCEAIKAGMDDANQYDENTWQGVLSNIAVYGREGLELAHEFSQGYDMSQITGDSTKTYSKGETDKKYFNKVDYIQCGGIPTSCKRLSEDGWTCPKLEVCHCGMIAKYDVPTSFGVHSKELPIPTEQRFRLYLLEQKGLYELFRRWVYTKKVMINIVDRITQEYKWIPVDLTDEKIALHLLGIEEFKVEIISQDWTKNRSIYVELPSDSMAQLESKLQTSNVSYWKPHPSAIWIICSTEIKTSSTKQILTEAYGISRSIYHQSLDCIDFTIEKWQTAPFYDDLSEIEKLMTEVTANGNV
jgi:hypothetical protein